MSQKKRFKYIALAVFFSLIIFAGCSIKETVKNENNDEGLLKQRVMEYCELRIKGDFVKSYEYEDPIARKRYGINNYIKRMSGGMSKWIAADIKDVQLKEDVAMVNLDIQVKGGLGGNMVLGQKTFEHDAQVSQKWVKHEGLWYHVFKANK